MTCSQLFAAELRPSGRCHGRWGRTLEHNSACMFCDARHRRASCSAPAKCKVLPGLIETFCKKKRTETISSMGI